MVDDLLTSGAHFRAAQRVLSRHFPDIDVVGLFLARRVMETAADGTDAAAMPLTQRAERGRRASRGVAVDGPEASIQAAVCESGSRRRAGELHHVRSATEGDSRVRIVSVINYKGGVGKTTLTANLAAELAQRGKRILALDMDAQCSLTFSFVTPDYWESELGGAEGQGNDRTIKKWFDGIVEDEGDVIPLDELVLRDLKAKDRLGDKGGYDYVLIDCPPNFNIVTKNAIVASDQIVIPAKPDYLSTLGIDYLLRSLGTLVREFNEDSKTEVIAPRILGVIFTMIQVLRGRPIGVQRQYMRADSIAVPIFRSTVRENKTIFGDAPEDGIPVVLERPRHEPYVAIVREMESLAVEFLKRSGG